MTLDYRKHEFKRETVLQDTRGHFTLFLDKIKNPQVAATAYIMSAVFILIHPWFLVVADLLFFYNLLYFIWFVFFARKYQLPFKMPMTARRIDPNNKGAGGGKAKMAEGILYIGNEEKTNEEIWFTNSDARTHILYLGTTGSGKTEGLKSLVSNALGWGSGFVFVDGKADTDLWGSLSGLARRFGRDDDILILNYMTGNSDARIASNTINPFAQGSASYLSNMLVSLMPESGGDNAMWKDRAVALVNALLPVLTWLRDKEERLLNISVIRDSLIFKRVVELSRESAIPERLRKGIKGYLDTLPGYNDVAFNDDGTEKPNPSGPPIDYGTIYQQHGYLAMQFTRQLQSLADDYGYIFETPSADIDMMDVVLNRRLLIVLIPALEKSADETANLGKIVGTMLKGMMGATLGSSVEGDTELALENKPTRSSTPFMAVFDEVGYYTTQGMGVMAAQARSLGFCLVFAGQDLPAMEKRVKEEARSIVANCNLKIFGKLEDPTQTKEFFEKTVGEASVIESSSRKKVNAMFGQQKLDDTENYSVTTRVKASYDQLKAFKEGQSVVTFGDRVVQAKMFYSNVGKIKSLRVNKFITMTHPDPDGKRASKDVDAILERVRDRTWTAANVSDRTTRFEAIELLVAHFKRARKERMQLVNAACYAMTRLANLPVTALAPKTAPQAAAPKPPTAPMPTPASAPAKPVPRERQEPPVYDQPPQQSAAPTIDENARKEAETKGTEGTISWDALMAGETTESVSSSAPVAAKSNTQKETAPAPPQTGTSTARPLPSQEETVSWKDLIAEEPATKTTAQTSQASPPATGFGVSGFGTGFGGVGGLGTGFGGIGGLGNLAGVAPQGSPSSQEQKPAKEVDSAKIEEAVERGETINWKDLMG